MNLTRIFLDSIKPYASILLERVSEYDIFCYFIGRDVEVGTIMLSPIRTDKNPTFILFVPHDKDTVLFKDFAGPGGNVFKFVKLLAAYRYGLTLPTFTSIVAYIDSEMGIGVFDSTVKRRVVTRALDTKFYASSRIIKFKSRDYTDRDLFFWKKYHITEDTLELFNIRSVHKLLNIQNEVTYTVSQSNLVFAFVMYNKVKLYRPEEDREFKWRNTCPGHYIQGLQQVLAAKSGNRNLIITKSMKDIMVFHTFLKASHDVIAPHSETYNFSQKLLSWMIATYNKIFIIFDYDLAGVTGANKLRKKSKKFIVSFVSTERIAINGSIKTIDKDISDFAVGRSKEEVTDKLTVLGLT